MATSPSEKLRRARTLRGVSQANTDRIVGVPADRTRSYERGLATPPKVYLQVLSRAWRIPLEWFTDGEDTAPPTEQGVLTDRRFPWSGHIPGDPAPRQTGRALLASAELADDADAHWRTVATTDYEPQVRRGDVLLVVVDKRLRAGSLYVVATDDDDLALAFLGRDREWTAVGGGPVPAGRALGYVPEINRALSDSAVLSFRSEIGLTVHDLTV